MWGVVPSLCWLWSGRQTGEDIAEVLIPNYNIKRLIADLLSEGGEGLVYKSTGAEDEEIEEILIVYEDVLVLQCMGPADNDMYQKTIRVNKEGAAGGRRRLSSGCKESIVFSDHTVSRRHFEIGWSEENGRFFIMDQGSAGGTYLRIPYSHPRPLADRSMILVGKHQFEVVAPVRLPEVMKEVEKKKVLKEKKGMDDSGTAAQRAAASASGASTAVGPLLGDGNQPQMYLHCFGPDGSPMQFRNFAIGARGATIGRKQSNSVSLSQEKGDEVLGLDSAVSGEHCRIEYNATTRAFEILDGTADKPSTNGTWMRLSQGYQTSRPQLLDEKDEILIGGVLRFAVSMEKSLVERDVQDHDEGADSDDSGATAPDQVHLTVDDANGENWVERNGV